MPSIGDRKTVTKNGKQYEGIYTASGWMWSLGQDAPKAPSYTPPKPAKSPLRGLADSVSGAAKGTSSAAKAVAKAAGDGKVTTTTTMTGKDGTKYRYPQKIKDGKVAAVDGGATRVTGTGSGSSRTGGSPSGPRGSSSGRSGGSDSRPAAPSSPASPSKPKSKPKPGKTYRNTRTAYESERDSAPRRYETPEQQQERKSKSKFDMDMSGADIKAKRKKYLDTHPAAAKAVANGTMSMGDINLIVRRLSKRGFDWNKLKK